MLSVLIHTFNEEYDLPSCLEQLTWCDDIIIYDSYSTDLTESIALSAGARFIQRPEQDTSTAFGGNESYHRTWALREIRFFYPWVLVLDADERLTEQLRQEIFSLLAFHNSLEASGQNTPVPVAYQIRRFDYFLNRHLKHVQATPWYIRLFRPEYIHYERLINPITVVHGPIGSLHSGFAHYPFSKGLSHWINRHNIYSTLEALEISSAHNVLKPKELFYSFFLPEFHQRRALQKQLFMSLPCRPLIKFLWLYIFKRGFLDGYPGFAYSVLQSIYEYFIVLKSSELREC